MEKVLCIFSIAFVAISIALSLIGYSLQNHYNNLYLQKEKSGIKLFTPEGLKEYNGINKPELYLGILGTVFDVTKGKKRYAPGEPYNILIGRDASRSFITGQFNIQDVTDDLKGLDKQQLKSLHDWLSFYKRDYTEVGKLIGRYYDNFGRETDYYKEIKNMIQLAEEEKQAQTTESIKYPPCNIEWSPEHGSRVWCTKRSGGIERTWIGVPRRLFEPGSNSYRCACINENELDLPNIKEYDNCNPTHSTCNVKE